MRDQAIAAAQARLERRLGPAPVEVIELAPAAPERRAEATGAMDSALRREFLAALGADLALHPRALLAAGTIPWATRAAKWAS